MSDSSQKMSTSEGIGERRDLRNALLVAGACIIALGMMILASGPIPSLHVLDIPTLENSLLVAGAVVITVGGLGAMWLNLPTRRVAWVALVAYTLIISLTVHYSGGPLTPMPALYLLVVVGASFLLGQRGAAVIAVLSTACYAIILYLEYSGALSMVLIWRLAFNPRERGVLLVVNWLAISIPALLTSQLAGTLAARLRQTNLQLRESERQRESLTSMIVHDLRNPLTGMMGGLDVLRMTLPKKLTADQQRLLDISRRNSQVLLDMISELLDISKMEAGQIKLNVQPVDLLELIVKSIDSVSALTDVEQLTIKTRLAEVEPVPCDRQLINRVIANLLSNAIKHTPPGGTIIIETRPSTDQVTVSVADTGEGIPVEYQRRIFDKFGQIEKPGEERRGTGLGLTFCKMAVEAHGGRIWVESHPGQGSTFFFTLPYR